MLNKLTTLFQKHANAELHPTNPQELKLRPTLSNSEEELTLLNKYLPKRVDHQTLPALDKPEECQPKSPTTLPTQHQELSPPAALKSALSEW
jgi:hypothetical protein